MAEPWLSTGRVKLNKGTNSATTFRKKVYNPEPYEKFAPPILAMIFWPNFGRSKSREAVVFERYFSIPMRGFWPKPPNRYIPRWKQWRDELEARACKGSNSLNYQAFMLPRRACLKTCNF
jgi:hypothetical protein